MIKYDPTAILRKIAPKSKVEKLLSGRVSLKKTALKFVDKFDIIDKSDVMDVALKTIKGYKDRIKADPDIKDEILDDPKQLVQRVQNEVIFQIGNVIKERYDGEFYRWLPSDADDPRPEHQLNYGGTFQVGVGEMPGDAYGCRCGMEILTDDETLNLTEA
jgi:hypothetical protein